MKKPTPKIRASHVNSGTGVPHDELPWPKVGGRIARTPKLHPEVDERSVVTAHGGLDVALQFWRRYKIAQRLDAAVEVLKVHLPYHESDHILAQALNLYVGGTCLEDMAELQQSEAILRMTGACRLPDPTTGGDFLRRFDGELHPSAYDGLVGVVNEVQEEVWQAMAPRRGRRRQKQALALVDLDAHTKVLYGNQKEMADFNYRGKWSYQPLLLSLGNTGECLALENRPGNIPGSFEAEKVLEPVLDRLRSHFEDILVRADSDFDRGPLRRMCEEHGAYFAFVGREFKNRRGQSAAIPESDWRPFRTRAERAKKKRRAAAGYRTRRNKANARRRRAQKRNYKELRLNQQWVAETTYKPGDSDKTYRLIIRRQLIEHRKGQQVLFEDYRYRYVVTNLPRSYSAEDVIDATYERCDQENMIEQMGSGLAAWRMPVAEFDGNCAWLEIARLAWNMAKWIAQLALPEEVVRWEWKRFRRAFVHIAAAVVKKGRRIMVRLAGSHRFAADLVAAHQRLLL